MSFSYQKTEKRRGIELILKSTLCYLMWLCLYFGAEAGKGYGEFEVFILNAGIFFGALIFFLDGYYMYRSSGGWDIKITDTEVIWKSSSVRDPKNFKVPIKQILKIIYVYGPAVESSTSCCLHLTDGKEIELKDLSSGVNLKKFFKALKKLGIKAETIP